MFWRKKKKTKSVTPSQGHRLAIGLSYDNNRETAPTLSVRGEHLLADEIVRIAKRYGVPVVEDEALATALRDRELDEEIPEELYQAVAVVLHTLESK